MHLRRPLATVLTALALLGGGATACADPAGSDTGRRDGTSDEEVQRSGAGEGPNYSDPEREVERAEDNQDPD